MDKGRESQGVRTDLLSIVDKKLPQHNTRDEILQEKGREKQVQTLGGYKHNSSVLSTIDKTDIENHNTRDEISKELGWSTGKVAMADKVWKEAKPEIKKRSS